MTSPQQTIAKEAYYKGIGLHTGNLCKIVFKPAPENNGVTLVRIDLPGPAEGSGALFQRAQRHTRDHRRQRRHARAYD